MELTGVAEKHVRGTDLEIHGWVWKGKDKKDISLDTFFFAIAKEDLNGNLTPIVSNSTHSMTITKNTDGSWILVAGPTITKRVTLPDEEYWMQADIIDVSSGKRHTIGRGKLILLPSPFE